MMLIAPFTFQKVEVNNLVVKSAIKPKIKPKVIEKPLHKVKLPNFKQITDIDDKKKQFFDFLRPSVIKENEAILAQRHLIELWLEKVSLEETLADDEQRQLQELVKIFKVNEQASILQQLNKLLIRIDIVPSALVLVQAANESAWGTSRFARIGLNFFGIWCYRPTCGMVPNGRDGGARHEVAAFQSVDAAVKRYLHNINTNNAYTIFRTIRAQLRAQDQPLQAEVLATGLLPYSERGSDYVLEITEMIRHNQSYLFNNDIIAIGD